MSKYLKFLAALAGAAIEGIALWTDAPTWVLALVPVLTAASVYRVPNTPA